MPKNFFSHAYHHLPNRSSSGSYSLKKYLALATPPCRTTLHQNPLPMSRSLRTPSGTITPNQTLEQRHAVMQAITLSIKSSSDAKQHLYKKGWAFPGEEITLETLTRTLFTAVADNKITPALANPILAMAYLITRKVKECTTLNITSAITKHLLDAFILITTDIQTRLEDHLQAVNDSNKLHADLANKLSSTQEKLDETTKKVNSNT